MPRLRFVNFARADLWYIVGLVVRVNKSSLLSLTSTLSTQLDKLLLLRQTSPGGESTTPGRSCFRLIPWSPSTAVSRKTFRFICERHEEIFCNKTSRDNSFFNTRRYFIFLFLDKEEILSEILVFIKIS